MKKLNIKINKQKISDVVSAGAVLLLVVGAGVWIYVWQLQHKTVSTSTSNASTMSAINMERQAAIDAAKKAGKSTYSFTTGKMPPPIAP